MDALFWKANDIGWSLRVLEACVEARKARDPTISWDVLHPEVPGAGNCFILLSWWLNLDAEAAFTLSDPLWIGAAPENSPTI